MKAQFLLVVFDITSPALPSNARQKFITKGDFQVLQEDYFSNVELDSIPFDIINRRWFAIPRFEGHTMVMVLDVKPVK